MRWPPPNRLQKALLPMAGLTVLVFLAAWVGIVTIRETGRIAAIWLANAVLMVALLRSTPRTWPAWLLCGLAGCLGSNLAYDGSITVLSFLLCLCNTVEVLVAVALFRAWVPDARVDLARVRPLLIFIVTGGVAGPLASAALAATVIHLQTGLPYFRVFRTWFSADSLGLLILVPLLAGATWREFREVVRGPRALEFIANLVMVPVAAGLVLRGHSPWIFLLSPLFLWSAFRHGFTGVASAIGLATAGGIYALILENRAGHLLDLRADIAFLQIFLFTNVLIFLPVATLLRALRESEHQFRLLFDQAPVGMAITDSASGGFLSVNPRLADILGYPPADLLRRRLPDLADPGHQQAYHASVGSLAAGAAAEVETEARFVHSSGRTVWARLRMVRLPAAADTPSRHLTLLEDITERTMLEMKLLQSQKMESLGVLAGGVAHDMNNVLGAILGLASRHQELQPPGSALRSALDTICDAAERGGNMVRRLLNFARHQPSDVRTVDLNSLLLEQARLLEHTTLSRVQLELDLAADLRPVLGDATALTHAFMNLCINAVDAMPIGGTLTLRTRNLGNAQVEVLVADTGSGMSREVLQRALDPFYTTKAVGKGTGLGLSMVYTAVKAHQGQVELESEPGRGTRVRILLPVAPADAIGSGQ